MLNTVLLLELVNLFNKGTRENDVTDEATQAIEKILERRVTFVIINYLLLSILVE